MLSSYELRVVNCFQICIFVLGNTTSELIFNKLYRL